MISPVRTSVMQAGGGLGLELVARRDQLVAQRVLHAQIDGELDRLLQPVGGEPRHVQVGEPAAVEPLLDAGDALVVDVDVADHVRDHRRRSDRRACSRSGSRCPGCRAGGSRCCWLGVISRLSQTKPRFDDSRSRTSLASRSGSTAVSSSTASSTSMISRGSREQRGRLHVGGEDLAVAVEDVGPRGRDRVCGRAARDRRDRRLMAANMTSRSGDDRIDRRERQDRQARRRACAFSVAVDIAAVEQRAQRAPLASGFPTVAVGLSRRCIAATSLRRCAAAGTLAGRCPARRVVEHGADRIGRRARNAAGGRSGSRSSWSNCVPRPAAAARWRLASPWMRPGVSSFAHSARSAAMASRSRARSRCAAWRRARPAASSRT